jgi:hypothetical protein
MRTGAFALRSREDEDNGDFPYFPWPQLNSELRFETARRLAVPQPVNLF